MVPFPGRRSATRRAPGRLGAWTSLTLLAFALGAPALHAQRPSPSVSLGFGVDSTTADVRDIVRLVRAYLDAPDTTAALRGLWSTSDPLDRRSGDVARGYAYQGFPATIVGVLSTGRGDSVYVVKVLHARAEGGGRGAMPLALQRLYAVRAVGAPHGWQLANALPRLTREWPTHTAGHITFHYAPGQRPDTARAARAARFVDSVATLFGVRPPGRLDYYVTASPDEYYRALGLDFFPLPSGRGTGRGGNALPEFGIVLSGDPGQGEAYLHELVHAVLGPHQRGGVLVAEGLPTWLAGSGGRPARELFTLLDEFQRTHPDVTLEALVRGELASGWGVAETDALYASGALVVEAIHRRHGMAGLRELLRVPDETDELLAAIRTHLGLPAADPAALERWWRTAARAMQGDAGPPQRLPMR
jgi:hypothetical protein